MCNGDRGHNIQQYIKQQKDKIPLLHVHATAILLGTMNDDEELNEAMFQTWDKKKKNYEDILEWAIFSSSASFISTSSESSILHLAI